MRGESTDRTQSNRDRRHDARSAGTVCAMIDARNPDYDNTPASPRRPAFGYAPEDRSVHPIVSIVTPFYNGAARVFDETATSVFRQSFQGWEWLIINDCTTDPEALSVLNRYRMMDCRIHVIDHAANRGLPAARNSGFAAARGEFVMLLDDDDLLEPTAIEKMLWHLISYPEVSVANGWSVNFGAEQSLWPAGFECRAQMLHVNSTTGRAMVRKSAHRAVGGYDEALRNGMEDWDFWLRLADHGLWGSTIPEYLDWYRKRENHFGRWSDLKQADRLQQFRAGLRERHARLYQHGLPVLAHRVPELMMTSPIRGSLTKNGRRLLMLTPAFGGDLKSRESLSIVAGLAQSGWYATVVATDSANRVSQSEFARMTPDVFSLCAFLTPSVYPAFIRCLIESRRPDVVVLRGSEFARRILPFLRTTCGEAAYVNWSECAAVGAAPEARLLEAMAGKQEPPVPEDAARAACEAGIAWILDQPSGAAVQWREAEASVAHIRNSRLWRAVERLERLWPLSWDRSARRAANCDDPRDELDRMRRHPIYRLARWAKRARLYRWYARRRHGDAYEHSAAHQL
jgi:glycosyltransferase involved in cell wall biosynthesis